VTAAVARAEQATEAEICPVVARASGRYDRAEDIVGLWTALLALSLLWFLWPPKSPEPHVWGEVSPTVQLGLYIVVMVLSFLVGVLAANRVDWLRRLFTPRREMADEVRRRAQAVFFDQRVHHVDSASGVLIYVSLYERQAAILADEHVLTAVGQETIDRWCRDFTTSLHREPAIDAMCGVIEQIGTRLSESLPRRTGNVNEVPDALVVLD
jgi:putative membrane protein